MKNVDVLVIGLGSIGSMALWHAASASASASGEKTVLGIEQFGRVHAESAYTGESRLFRVAAKEGELYTPALLRSRELWKELGKASGRDILLEAGALSIAAADHPDINHTLQSIDRYDLPHERFDAAELRDRFPQFHIEDDDIGVLDSLGGAMRPETAILAATEQAIALGAQVWTGTTVSGIDETASGVVVHTSTGLVRAGTVIVTAGPWAARLLPELAELTVVRSYALTWMMPRHIEWFMPDRFPGFMRDLGDVHAFGVPTLDGFSIKICPHLTFDDVADVADRPTALSREQLTWAGIEAQRMVPDLVPEPVRWSVHPDAQTASTKPIIDTLASGRITVAAGLSGNGFKFAPLYGKAVVELALEGSSTWQHPSFTMAAHHAAAEHARSADR